MSLKYCTSLLTNRAPKDQYKEIIKFKHEIHELRMKEFKSESEMELSEDMFISALKRLKEKHSDKYRFILRGGKSLYDALFVLMKAVWNSEEIPSLWKKTDIVQIYKGKGNMNEVSNYRNIHTKCDTRKLFGEILTHEVKFKTNENISKFQIGAIAGHRAQEHIFTLKSVISLYKKKGKGLILCLYDLSKYFD